MRQVEKGRLVGTSLVHAVVGENIRNVVCNKNKISLSNRVAGGN
jgi:hypothetical protein